MCVCSKIDYPLILLKKLVTWINEVQLIWIWLLFLHGQRLEVILTSSALLAFSVSS